MIETVILTSTALALVGAIIASYQLVRVWTRLGTPFSGDMGSILTEHLLFGAIWLTGMMFWALVSQLEVFTGDTRDWMAAVLGVFIMVIVWSFVIRTHIWYRNIKGD